MANDLLAALALVLVLEGILPFASPGTVRRIWENISNMSDQALRIFGLVSMIVGVLLLAIVRQN